jgi:hypothetical protein
VTKEHWVKPYNIFLSMKVTIEYAGLVLGIRDTRVSNFGPEKDLMTYIFRDFP